MFHKLCCYRFCYRRQRQVTGYFLLFPSNFLLSFNALVSCSRLTGFPSALKRAYTSFRHTVKVCSQRVNSTPFRELEVWTLVSNGSVHSARTDWAPDVRIGHSLQPIKSWRWRTWPMSASCNAQFTPPARHDKTVLSGSCLAWRCEVHLLLTCLDFTFSVGYSLELSRIQFTPPRQTRHRQDCFVGSGLAMWIGYNWVDLLQISSVHFSSCAAN